MTRYELFKLLHVAGAVLWVGAGAGLFVLTRRLIAASDRAALVSIGRQSRSLGTWLFVPAALLTVVFGVALVATEPAFGFTDLWILLGFGGILLSGAVQSTLTEPANKRLLSLADTHGLDDDRVVRAAHHLTLGSGIDTAILLLVVLVMVAKPTL